MSPGALAGITVLEFAGIGPGPFACGLLADMGAAVIRVERPQGVGSLPGGLNRIGVADRIILEVDVKSEDGLALVRSLFQHVDVVVEGFRPGVATRLGIGPTSALEANPGIVYASITGWGQDGPYASMAGHDINYIGLSGVLAAIGGGAPTPPLNLVGDYGGGSMFAIAGILAALVKRDRSGEGSVIDVAMVDGSAKLLEPIRALYNAGVWSEQRGSNLLDGGAPFYRTYRTADDGYVAVGALEPAFYDAFIRGLGLDPAELPDRMDPSRWSELEERFSAVFGTRTRDAWAEVFEGTDACVTPVLMMSEVGDHPHNAVRNALRMTEGGPMPTAAPRFAGHEATSTNVATVLETLVALGLPEDAAERLVEEGTAYRV